MRDGFKRQRNADYPALEEFFGLHVTDEEGAWQGWRSWSTPWSAPWRCDALIAPFHRCSDDATPAACVPQAKLLERGISQPINCAPGGNFSDLHKSLPPAVGLRQNPYYVCIHLCASHGRHRLLMAQGRMRTSLLGDEASQSVAVLIFPGFPMMAFSSIIEPLRASNVLSKWNCYSWVIVAADEGPVTASNGVTIAPDFPASSAPSVYRNRRWSRWRRRSHSCAGRHEMD